MIPTRPQVAKTGRYTIAESARALGVSRTTLYRWMADGAIRVMVTRKTYRRYISGEELLRVWDGEWLMR